VGKCDQYIQNISDYIDGELAESVCEDIEDHLKGCKNCRIMVDTMKQTVVLCREGKQEQLPKHIEDKLNSALKKRWEEKFGKNN